MNTPLGRMSIFQPLDETTKAELITERLTQAIESGMLKNGEKLPGESEMAHMFAVSPITTREALEQLRSEDLVETRRGRDGGSFITSSPSRNIQRLESNLLSMPTMEIKDHRALYIALVSSSARLATEEASARERNAILEAIQSLVNDLETAGTENDNYLTHGHHEMQLHIEIAAATTSPHLVNSLIDLQDKLKHLLWLRFADKEQIDFLAKQYKYAAHLLSTNQDQLFERRITDIIKVGFHGWSNVNSPYSSSTSKTRYLRPLPLRCPTRFTTCSTSMQRRYMIGRWRSPGRPRTPLSTSKSSIHSPNASHIPPWNRIAESSVRV